MMEFRNRNKLLAPLLAGLVLVALCDLLAKARLGLSATAFLPAPMHNRVEALGKSGFLQAATALWFSPAAMAEDGASGAGSIAAQGAAAAAQGAATAAQGAAAVAEGAAAVASSAPASRIGNFNANTKDAFDAAEKAGIPTAGIMKPNPLAADLWMSWGNQPKPVVTEELVSSPDDFPVIPVFVGIAVTAGILIPKIFDNTEQAMAVDVEAIRKQGKTQWVQDMEKEMEERRAELEV